MYKCSSFCMCVLCRQPLSAVRRLEGTGVNVYVCASLGVTNRGMCMCMCVYFLYTCKHTCIQACIHTYTHTYIRIYIPILAPRHRRYASVSERGRQQRSEWLAAGQTSTGPGTPYLWFYHCSCIYVFDVFICKCICA